MPGWLGIVLVAAVSGGLPLTVFWLFMAACADGRDQEKLAAWLGETKSNG